MMKTYQDLMNSEYTIKNGRLINNASPRREVHRSKKIAKIADGIEMAEARKEMRKLF